MDDATAMVIIFLGLFILIGWIIWLDTRGE
jgi:hypothetical protein